MKMDAVITIAIGISVLILTLPISLIALLTGTFMCDSPRSDITTCNIVGFGPGIVTALVGLAIVGRGVVLLVRAKR